MVVGLSKKSLYVSLIPFVLFMGLLVFCVLWAITISFTDKSLIGASAVNPQFIGLKNYIKLLTHPNFINSLKVTFLFTFISSVLGQCGLGLILAVLLKQRKVHFKPFYEVAILLGWLLPDMVAAFMWGAFASSSGFLNTVLMPLGLDSVNWITVKPLTTIIIANIWKGTAWSYLLFAAALDTVPGDLFEAADVDGATAMQKLMLINIPIILPTILVNILLVTIWTFGYFSLVYGMTGGGPGHSTEVISILMYKEAFESFRIGYGSAISISMTIIVGFLSILYFWGQRRASDVSGQ